MDSECRLAQQGLLPEEEAEAYVIEQKEARATARPAK